MKIKIRTISKNSGNFQKKIRTKQNSWILTKDLELKALVQTHAEWGGVLGTPPLIQDLGWRGILADLRLTSDMEFGDILGVLGSVLRHVESRRAC